MLLDELTEESIRVVADLKDINQAAGKYTVPATIYLDSAGTLSDVGDCQPHRPSASEADVPGSANSTACPPAPPPPAQ